MNPHCPADMEDTIMTVPISATTTLETGPRVRKATGQDLPVVVETLTAAFFDDP